jgi:single-strand DNA-binding protein
MNLNKVFLIGRLTRDPEMRSTQSGQNVCNFGLATNRTWTNSTTKQKEEKTEFHNIVMWGKLAQIASQYLKKGSLALIEGRLQTRSWEDKTGNKKYTTEIIAENMQMGPRSSGSSNSSGSFAQKQEAKSPITEEEIPIIEEEGAEEEINVKDIPF